MTYEFLKIHVEDRVAWIEYRRPPLNAIDWKMLREIPTALDALLADPGVRIVVFASALEKYFSTGADLSVFQEMRQEDMREWVQTCHALVRQIRQAPKPLLGAIHGTAVGGGLEIVLNCDIRFAAADARLGQPEINIGFIPPVGTTQSLPRLLGRARAIRFLYEGTLVSAEEAQRIGLVDFVVQPERLREEVQEYGAGRLLQLAEHTRVVDRKSLRFRWCRWRPRCKERGGGDVGTSLTMSDAADRRQPASARRAAAASRHLGSLP